MAKKIESILGNPIEKMEFEGVTIGGCEGYISQDRNWIIVCNHDGLEETDLANIINYLKDRGYENKLSYSGSTEGRFYFEKKN